MTFVNSVATADIITTYEGGPVIEMFTEINNTLTPWGTIDNNKHVWEIRVTKVPSGSLFGIVITNPSYWGKDDGYYFNATVPIPMPDDYLTESNMTVRDFYKHYNRARLRYDLP